MRRSLSALLVAMFIVLTLTTPAFAARTLTGDGELPFPGGANVVGAVITFDDGSVVYGCHIFGSAVSGKVKNGVIDPWPQEATKFPPCFGAAGAQAAPPAPTGAAALGVDGQPRLLTSDAPDNRLPFAQGDAVVGTIEMNDKTQGPCHLASAPTNGVVTAGVVHPWEGEMAKFPACAVDGAPAPVQAAAPPAPQPQAEAAPSDPASDADSRRKETGVGQWLDFGKGDSVGGAYLVLHEPNGDTDRKGCYFDSAPYNGRVNTGVLFPRDDEKAGMPACK